MYDLIIRNGEVIDPGNALHTRGDIAVSGGVIVAVGPAITDTATTEIDATGCAVTPGLVDLHTHVYWGATYWGIEADPVCAVTGVTTSVDAGSAGAYTWPAFRRFQIAPSRSRILAFLNISSIGLAHATYELANPAYTNADLAVATVEEDRDLLVGIKARIDPNTVGGRGTDPLTEARTAADRVGLPLMVHIGNAPPALADILPWLKAGDILTHCFTGNANRIVADDPARPARVRAEVMAARERGVLMDIGHGAGSFHYPTTEVALAAGFLPDVISSDIHQFSVRGPMYDLPTTLSKFLNLGLALPEVIARATLAPARAIGRGETRGTLGIGRAADIAVWQIEEGAYSFQDIAGNSRPGTQRLRNMHTFVAGQELPRDLPRARVLWPDRFPPVR